MNKNNKQNAVPNASDFTCEFYIDGSLAAYFPEIQNIGIDYEVIQHKIVGPGGVEVVSKLPGRRKIKKIILKRKIFAGLDMWDWRRMVEEGDIANARENCTIVVYDVSSIEIARWNLTNAWPISIVSERDVNGDNYEVLTLGCEELERQN